MSKILTRTIENDDGFKFVLINIAGLEGAQLIDSLKRMLKNIRDLPTDKREPYSEYRADIERRLADELAKPKPNKKKSRKYDILNYSRTGRN